jgi:hypothetical protein
MSELKFLHGEAATPAPVGERPRVAAYDLGSNSFHLLSPKPMATVAWSS